VISDKEMRDRNADYTVRRERSWTVSAHRHTGTSAHLYQISHKAVK